MKPEDLYARLDKDFIKENHSDEWSEYMPDYLKKSLTKDFLKQNMGLMLDFADEVSKVYTAVFPSKESISQIIERGEENVLLFCHHAANWDIRRAPNVFEQIPESLLEEMRKKKISLYVLHVPLDDENEYSTSVNLARAVNAEPVSVFAPYRGAMAGIIAKTNYEKVSDVKKAMEKAIGHEAKIYTYGDEKLSDGLIGIIGGGGNDKEYLEELKEKNVNMLITGITARNDHSEEAHRYAEENKVNLLGGTHYSTEKFACMKMCEYFKELGLESDFLRETPVVEDL